MSKLLEKFEDLFVPKRKETTYKRAMIGLVLVLMAGFSMPAYFRYEDHIYEKYKYEYNQIREKVNQYKGEYGTYPIREAIIWSKEENLREFIEDKKLTISDQVYYLDQKLIEGSEDTKYTYMIDIRTERIYTREFVVYKFSRWHFPFY